MPFNPNVPQATDRLAKSQQDLLQNNQKLDTSFGINHYEFSDLSANNGMHKQCQLVELANPIPVIGTDSLYCAVTGTPSLGELFYVRGGGGTPIQMTGPGNPLASANGYTFLPGGILIQWGTVTPIVSSTTTPVLFATANIDFQNNCFVVLETLINPSSTSNAQTISIRKSSISKTGFSYNYSGGSAYDGFYWIAIGN